MSQDSAVTTQEGIAAVKRRMEDRNLQSISTNTYSTRQYCASSKTYYYSRMFICPAATITTTTRTPSTPSTTYSSRQYCSTLRSYYYSRSFSCPTASTYYSLSTYVYAGDSYTYSSRQYCSIYREYYYDRMFKCSKANQGGPIGGGVGGAIAFVLISLAIYCYFKKKQAEKNAQ